MYHPTTRVLTVLEMLQSHQNLSGTALARRLEVDPRTIRRYVLMLQDMGIPIEATQGRYGGYELRPGFKLPPLMFSDEEGVAVILGLMIARQIGLVAAAPAIEGAIAKLERVLPTGLRERVRALQQSLTLDLPRADVPVASVILATLSVATYQKRQVTLVYEKDSETTERTFDSYGIVSHGNRWYAVGYCHLRSGLRVFRLDRVTRVELLDTAFIRPANFDSLAYLLQSIANIPDRWEIEVLLNTTLNTAASKMPPGFGTLTEQQDGVLLCASMPDLDEFARFLVGMGCALTVRKPPELRAALRNLAREIARYASDGE